VKLAIVDISEIQNYLDILTDSHSNIEKIWLIGSRIIENTEWKSSPASDWDLVIFADQSTRKRIMGDDELLDDRIDLMIVSNDLMNYVRIHKNESKRERLWEDWEWEEIDDKTATYMGTDGPGDEQRYYGKVIWPQQ
jgi:hypothetical protein